MKPPLSNNYCSTINIADESVCEMPVSKVMKWIENNDFQQSRDALKSDSFHSLATSEMFAYICKDVKKNSNKELSSELLPDCFDEMQMDKKIESVCNDTFDGYVDESNLNQKVIRANSCQLNPYCDESTVFNKPSQLNHSHSSLPNYVEENSILCGKNKKLQKSSSSISLDLLTLSQYPARVPTAGNLCISEDNHTNSLPVLTPYVSNPELAKSSYPLQSSCNKATKNIQGVTSSDTNLTGIQMQLNNSNKDYVDSGLNTGSTEALQSSGYYESSPSRSKETDSKNNFQNSASDQSDRSVSTSTSDIQTSIGYIELPSYRTKQIYFRTNTNSSSFSELDFDIDSPLNDIASTSNGNTCFTINSSNV